ncbi:PREDICTED: bidirectional sugar transporter SWEET14-like [Camelina sativa]|uniref:Bidirectional sugar transporter SWEET14-like n=1 Tax=Camelina sativa TaxID=90675 RepID=A0ABM0TZK8_CAMSA|nr:PREDICTED: bidirectional sugar transporter SWEET14-like [Camelina sativa]
MPFSLSLFLTLSAITWLFYGLAIKDFYVALPNILGAFLGAVQMILYVIFKYYKTPSVVVDETEKPKTVSADHSINMVKLSSTPASGELTVQPQTNPDVSPPVQTYGGDLEDQMDKKMSN